MTDGGARRVRAGFFSFTEITDPAAHRAYNEWHMLDHMPEQLPLPGIVWGQRWVLTPEHAVAAQRHDRFAGIHYVTLYLMSEPLDATLDEFAALGAALHATPGRWFEPRRARVSGPSALDALAVSADVPIRAEAVAARPHRGLHVRVGACPSPEELCAIPGVVGSWRFSGGSDDPLASRRRGGIHEPITVAWLDDADAALPGVAPDGLLAATFLPITPWAWDWFDPVG